MYRRILVAIDGSAIATKALDEAIQLTSTLIVYHSMTGSTKRVAELLNELTQWPCAEVAEVAEGGAHGHAHVSQAARRLPPAPVDYSFRGPDPGQFERLVVIAPAWLGKLALPMRAFLGDVIRDPNRQRPVKVSLVCVIGMDGALAATQEVTAILGCAPSPILLIRHDDVLDGSCVDELRALSEKVGCLDRIPANS